jgi:hypothetical protein
LPAVATICGRNERASAYSIVVTDFFPATVATAFVGRFALSQVYCTPPSGVCRYCRFPAASHVLDTTPAGVVIVRGRRVSPTSNAYVLVPDMSLSVVAPAT